MRSKIVVPSVGLFFCSGLGSILRRPAPQEVPGQQPLRYEVSVVLKLIQVYVTDKAGAPSGT